MKVYEKLRAVLEDPFVVFYSRPWLGTTASGLPKDGECDFVIAHPDAGFLALEVKGGAISYDSASDIWTSMDRFRGKHDIHNPAKQALESKHQLLRKCQAHPAWVHRRIATGHGIIFPDAEAVPGDLGADMPREIVCFADVFESDLYSWIFDLMDREMVGDYRVKPLGSDGIRILEEILAHPFQLHVPLQGIIRDDEQAIETLTPLQYQILTGLAGHKQVAIAGSAGTGKTILAMEEATRCLKAGERVLLTCYNNPLFRFMNRTLGERPGLTVGNYHSFCDSIFRKAGITVNREKIDNILFLEKYPEYLAEAFRTLPDERFDTIIIDEGQDFPLALLKSLELGLDPKGKGKIRLFYDDNQDVYHNQGQYLANMYKEPFALTLNLRNTKRIHELARQFYRGNETVAIGPEGLEIVWVENAGNVRACLDTYLHDLIEKEHIPPSDIAVLISTRDDKEKYSPDGKLAGRKYQFCHQRFGERTEPTIVMDSVTRFKGLESPVVVVVLDETLLSSEEKLYVAFSRARSLLAVVGRKEEFERILNTKK